MQYNIALLFTDTGLIQAFPEVGMQNMKNIQLSVNAALITHVCVLRCRYVIHTFCAIRLAYRHAYMHCVALLCATESCPQVDVNLIYIETGKIAR